MNFLIIQTAFIGDVILATAVAVKLRQFYPKAKIDFLANQKNISVLEGHPMINEVLGYDKSRNKFKALLKLSTQIRENNYDHVINLHRYFGSGLLATASNAKSIIGFDKNPLSFMYTKSIKHEFQKDGIQNHEIRRNQKLIEHLTDSEASKPFLPTEHIDTSKWIDNREYVCLAPASVWFTKALPVFKWVELIEKLDDKYHIYLLGAPNDIEICKNIKNLATSESISILAGKLSILESAAVMKKAIINFVNDSAPLHLCSATDAPVCAFFCSTIPEFGYGPLSSNQYIAQVNDLNCRPCGDHGKKECPKKHFKCAEINIDKVLNDLSLRMMPSLEFKNTIS